MSLRLAIPSRWEPGAYVARFESEQVAAEVPFVVRPRQPGRFSPIVLQLPVATMQAYNHYNGPGGGERSLYRPRVPPGHPPVRAESVSFLRPIAPDVLRGSFWRWEAPFIRWAEENGFHFEYCTSVDLHSIEGLLRPYELFLSVGHDEYWSWHMRDSVETFVRDGGNAAFFGGNTCWWQVRFDPTATSITCFKGPSDPFAVDPDRRHLTTTQWRLAPVNRPENVMTGVSFWHGAYWDESVGPRPTVGYTVRDAAHWVFAGTGLSNGDQFGIFAGGRRTIIGYETDAALFAECDMGPVPTLTDGAPETLRILATADLRDWRQGEGYSGPTHVENEPQTGPPLPPSGKATMVTFGSRGTVFTAGTTDWAEALAEPDPVVAQITHNVLSRLSTGGGGNGTGRRTAGAP